jgi:hypothetical protein
MSVIPEDVDAPPINPAVPSHPGTPEEPDIPINNDEDDDDHANTQSLAQSLALLANKIGSISGSKSKNAIKPRVPDTFDGTDPQKLQTFTFQCSMYLSARASDFPDEESKVTFALSYLKGTPLDWFQAELDHAVNHGGIFPSWFSSYALFVAEIRTNFGPRDPVTDAMNALENLRYKDSSKAIRYNVEFTRHARLTGWNEQALARQYYKGLPDRLKDEIARIGKPAGLKPMQNLVTTLDQRYWERQSEITRDRKAAPAPSTNSGKPASHGNQSSHRPANHYGQSATTSGYKPSSQNSSAKPDSRKPPSSIASSSGPPKPSISDLLGPDGKLKPEERKRRMDNNLCLRCGEAGHTASTHPGTQAKPKPKGRASAIVTAPTVPAPATSSGPGKG